MLFTIWFDLIQLIRNICIEDRIACKKTPFASCNWPRCLNFTLTQLHFNQVRIMNLRRLTDDDNQTEWILSDSKLSSSQHYGVVSDKRNFKLNDLQRKSNLKLSSSVYFIDFVFVTFIPNRPHRKISTPYISRKCVKEFLCLRKPFVIFARNSFIYYFWLNAGFTFFQIYLPLLSENNSESSSIDWILLGQKIQSIGKPLLRTCTYYVLRTHQCPIRYSKYFRCFAKY